MMLSAEVLSPRRFLWSSSPAGVSGDAVKIEILLSNASIYGMEYKKRTNQSLAINRLNDFLKSLEDESAVDEVINPSAIKEVEKALNSLPGDIPVPSLLDEGNGFMALEWYKNPKNVFLMSFNGTKTVEFASLFGRRNELRGQLEFIDEIPSTLIEQLRIFTKSKI